MMSLMLDGHSVVCFSPVTDIDDGFVRAIVIIVFEGGLQA
jgi:hypothetical protein